MSGLLTAFCVSFICTLLIIRYEHLHGHHTHDSDLTGPQKFHKSPVPRVGGISIALGLIFSTILSATSGAPKTSSLIILLISAIPCFAIGLLEDITKRVGVKMRLFFTAVSSLLAIYLLDVSIKNLGIPAIDPTLSIPVISFAFTCFAITGLANAYNIIDGFNGLASMVALIALLAIAYVGIVVKDPMIASISFIIIGAIGGFFIWNYPRGLIFLGDGGSYLLGFCVGVLSVMLVSRNSSVSPWFALLVNGYPVFETLFTIYRRLIHHRRNPGEADGVHFHTIIFRRVLRSNAIEIKQKQAPYTTNAKTSPYLWVFSGLAVVPAIIWWNSQIGLTISLICFIFTYIILYRAIIRFKTPKWL